MMMMINIFDCCDIEMCFFEFLYCMCWQCFGVLFVIIGILIYVFYVVWFFNLLKFVVEVYWECFSVNLL